MNLGVAKAVTVQDGNPKKSFIDIYLVPSLSHRTVIHSAKVRAAGVGIIWDPPS